MIGIVFFSLFSYLLGCITFAYYLTKIFTGQDLKGIGSGNLGAVNASRILGKKGFIISAILDMAKGAIIVILARYFNYSNELIFFFMMLVTLGHIFPVQLKFKGGKGISTIGGTFIALNPLIVICFIFFVLIFYIFIRKISIAALCSIALTPLLVFYFDYSAICILENSIIIGIIIFAHRSNIKLFFNSRKKIQTEKTT